MLTRIRVFALALAVTFVVIASTQAYHNADDSGKDGKKDSPTPAPGGSLPTLGQLDASQVYVISTTMSAGQGTQGAILTNCQLSWVGTKIVLAGNVPEFAATAPSAWKTYPCGKQIIISFDIITQLVPYKDANTALASITPPAATITTPCGKSP
jgi:hypothetical protein